MPPLFFPDEVLEHVLVFLTSHKDRNSVSLVCQAWYRAERWSRRHVFIGNCYAVSPEMVTTRFPKLKAVTLKGKPRFSDFGLVPPDWGASVYPWVLRLAKECAQLEELRFKRMLVTDESLELIATSFPGFKVLVLTTCEGFSVRGLATIARHCRHLTQLDLQENVMTSSEEPEPCWLEAFPDSSVSLETLNFAINSDSDVNHDALRSLVARCPNLRSLNVSKGVSMEHLPGILHRAPQLVELGTGSHAVTSSLSITGLGAAIKNCTSLRRLSIRWDLTPFHLGAMLSVFSNLISLDISYVAVHPPEFQNLMSRCRNLEKLSMLDFVGDEGLQAVGRCCPYLQELRVYPMQENGGTPGFVTEEGLISIADGCPKLSSILYFCKQMTNDAVHIMARKCSLITRFRLCIITPRLPDCATGEPMDEGFGAIVMHCKHLRRLAVSGLLTDRAFEYIGRYGKGLQTLSVAFAAESDMAMKYVLEGCPKLRKLEIRDAPLGDGALLTGIERFESMRFLWMSNCNVTYHGCRYLATRLPLLNVEIMKDDDWPSEEKPVVSKLYLYRSLAGPREDAPNFVVTFRSSGFHISEQ